MNFFKLWLKKVLFYRKRSVFLLIFLFIPLVLLSSTLVFFINGYYRSFEIYSQQNIGPDLSFFGEYHDFEEVNEIVKDGLENQPFLGGMSYLPIQLNLNLTIYNPTTHSKSYIDNQSLGVNAINFSNSYLKMYYINKYIPLTLGNVPSNNTEIIVPDYYRSIYNLTLNSVVYFQQTHEINQTAIVVGFYKGDENIRTTPKDSIIFLLNDVNNQLFDKFLNQSDILRYYIYLDHRQMDTFNIYSFLTQLTQIKTALEDSLHNSPYSLQEVFSSSFMYQTYEFNRFISENILEMIVIIAPIILIVCIFFTASSTLTSKIERDYWDKLLIFRSTKSLKIQILFNTLMNNFIAYLISLPFGILLYQVSYFIVTFSVDYEFYLPLSYYFLSFTFYIFSSFIIWLMIIRRSNKFQASNIGVNKDVGFNLLKKNQKLIVLLIIITLLPLLSKILQISLISVYNPILSSFFTSLEWLSSNILLFYSTIIVLLIILLFSRKIIKFIQYLVKKQLFSKEKNHKFTLLSKFFKYRRSSTLIIIMFLGIQLGFLNFYHFKNFNQSYQDKFELYLQFGSDFKLYDDYSMNYTFNLGDYIAVDAFCQIRSLPGLIEDDIFFSKEIIMINFNVSKYYTVLNNLAHNSIDLNFILNVQDLKSNEILVPSYLNQRYNMQVGDIIEIKPKNRTALGDFQIIDEFSTQFLIKGFFNYLPGVDNDDNFCDPSSSQANLLVVNSLEYNYSIEFPNITTKYTYLVKKFENSYNTMHIIKEERPDINYVALVDRLNKYSVSQISVSPTIVPIMYMILIISFIILTILFIYNYIVNNAEIWNLFQLFSLKKKELKSFISTGLISIILISFFIGVTGIASGEIGFLFENTIYKSTYYLYPIQIQFDLLGLLFNLIYLTISVTIILLIVKNVIDFTLNYENLRKYNPE